MNLEHIKQTDPIIAEQIEKELKRQQETIELIASENCTSLAVMEAAGSVLTNKYAEGKPHKRYYNGCEYIDDVLVSYSVWTMQMSNRIAERRQIWLCLWQL